MRKKLTVLVLVATITSMMFGCGNSDDKATSNVASQNQTTGANVEGTTLNADNTSEADSETTEEETTTEESTTSDYAGDYSEYSTEFVGYGCGARKTEDGRNEGAVYCENLYGQYQVEFLKENEKVIYLTFDEGYENGYTPAILDTLKEKNVKAVFFCTMDFVKAEPELVQRIIDEGHILGSHSVSHKSMPKLSVEEQKYEIMELHTYVQEHFNYTMYLFRPPMGEFSEQSLAVTGDLGYTSVLWSFAHLDYDVNNQPSKEEAYNTMVERLSNGAIYLLHAVSSANTAALGDFIDEARAEGYEFKEYTKDTLKHNN